MDDFLNQIVIDVKVIEFGCVGDRYCGMALCYCSIAALAEYFIPGCIIGSVFQVLGMVGGDWEVSALGNLFC